MGTLLLDSWILMVDICLRHFLVGGLVAIFYFPINIGSLIIPIDELIFFRGVGLAQQPALFEAKI